jgi:membrane associated rhomboid family serine protease
MALSWRETLRAVPPHTLLTITLCCGLQVGVYVLGIPLRRYTISAARVLAPHWELHRLVTAAYFHVGLLHIAMNMMSFLQLGASIERMFGTVTLALATAWFVVLSNCLYVAVCWG